MLFILLILPSTTGVPPLMSLEVTGYLASDTRSLQRLQLQVNKI